MYYEYKVTYWDEVDQENASRSGVMFAATSEEIIDRLDNYYGFDNLLSFTIYPLWDEFSIYEFNQDENHFKLDIHE